MHACPLSSLELKNFKSIADGAVEFKPLTVLVGMNSSGKSSLLQAIRFLSQTAQVHEAGVEVPLNGTKVRLGTLEDVRTLGTDGPVSFQAALMTDRREDPGDNGVESQALLTLGVAEPDTRPDRGYANIAVNQIEVSSAAILLCAGHWLNAIWDHVKVSWTAIWDPYVANDPLMWDDTNQLLGTLEEASGAERAFNHTDGSFVLAGVNDIRRAFASADLRTHDEFLQDLWESVTSIEDEWCDIPSSPDPDRLKRMMDVIHGRAGRYLDSEWSAIGLSMIEVGGLRFVADPAIDDEGPDCWPKTDVFKIAQLFVKECIEDEWAKDPVLIQRANRVLADRWRPAVAELLQDRVRYLGPLRQEPRPYFDFGDDSRPDVGAAGEHLPQVLQWHGTESVDVPGLGQADLVEGLRHWLRELELVEDVTVEARGRAGVSIDVRPTDLYRQVDLTSVGVGVSQVLPVLTICLLAKPGDIVLLEQPELHLHPALQMRLADFLLACVDSGRQVIVETHSEHLVNRFRRRVAEADSSDVGELVRIVFAERDAEGHTLFRPSDINPLGGLGDDWPDGFLDLGARDAQKLLQAGLAKHRRLSDP